MDTKNNQAKSFGVNFEIWSLNLVYIGLYNKGMKMEDKNEK